MRSGERLSLGDLIALLKRLPLGQNIRFDFGDLAPTTLDSYRGFYEDLALGFGDGVAHVGDLLRSCEAAVGATFEGYKGGTYRMDERSRLWVSNRGATSGTTIVGLDDLGWTAILRTGYEDV